MARKVTVKLTGQAEEFFNTMRKSGMSEQDIMAKGLYILREVYTTGRVALVENHENHWNEHESSTFDIQPRVQFYFRVGDQPAKDVDSKK